MTSALRPEADGGIDRDIPENVLLCMGGSRNPDGAIGGIGCAKTILFFAHVGYTIRTRDFLVIRRGGQYRLSDGQEHVSGTRISVELDDAADLLELWQDCIADYAQACYM